MNTHRSFCHQYSCRPLYTSQSGFVHPYVTRHNQITRQQSPEGKHNAYDTLIIIILYTQGFLTGMEMVIYCFILLIYITVFFLLREIDFTYQAIQNIYNSEKSGCTVFMMKVHLQVLLLSFSTHVYKNK